MQRAEYERNTMVIQKNECSLIDPDQRNNS